MKKMNKPYWALIGLLLALSACSDATRATGVGQQGSELQHTLKIYKSRTCKCCQKWVRHIKEFGFETDVSNVALMSSIKDKYGIAPRYRSCHSALSKDGFVFEGHIPAKFIKQFLASPPETALGLSVPGMPVGTPGMEVKDRFQPYLVLQLNKDGTVDTYAQVNSYEEQF